MGPLVLTLTPARTEMMARGCRLIYGTLVKRHGYTTALQMVAGFLIDECRMSTDGDGEWIMLNALHRALKQPVVKQCKELLQATGVPLVR